jgi:UDP-glucuronate 4-epimerase
MKVLVTGAAGFIGSYVCRYLIDRGDRVVGVDNLNDYYEVSLKHARIRLLDDHKLFSFVILDVADRKGMDELFAQEQFDAVVHLAAQAGVRYSIENPHAYMDSNIIGHLNVLEGCRHYQVEHLVYASSSSVYGANTLQPFSEHHNVDHPVSLYAASKKANELMAHSYSHLYGLKTTGLRFFTVYGPWGRPDMAYFMFTKAIIEGSPINVFNNGEMERDFTYIDDIVEGIVRALDTPATPNGNWSGEKPDPATSYCNYRIYNIGNNQPVKLLKFIETIEEVVGKKAVKNMLPMQAGDVLTTCADVSELQRVTGFSPKTPIEVGIRKFVEWYQNYYAN